MSRFFVPKEAVKGNNILVRGKEAHHILDVMRLKTLDKVVTFDGTGKEYTGFIKEMKGNSLTIEIIETKTPVAKDKTKITLIQAIPKKEKMDYIVEKSTELGVYSIEPVLTGRTIPDWNDSKKAAHVDRWMKIAREAAKQCGRADIPIVGEIKMFAEVLKDVSEFDLALIAALNDEAVSLKNALAGFKGGKVLIAIGPEGDFTAGEVSDAKRCGFKLVSLGSRVLKSDTAGLAALAILNYEFSN